MFCLQLSILFLSLCDSVSTLGGFPRVPDAVDCVCVLLPGGVPRVPDAVDCVFACCFQAEFREYPTLLRMAVSIARRVQEPLVEFAQMCNADEDILCLKYSPYQVHARAGPYQVRHGHVRYTMCHIQCSSSCICSVHL